MCVGYPSIGREPPHNRGRLGSGQCRAACSRTPLLYPGAATRTRGYSSGNQERASHPLYHPRL